MCERFTGILTAFIIRHSSHAVSTPENIALGYVTEYRQHFSIFTYILFSYSFNNEGRVIIIQLLVLLKSVFSFSQTFLIINLPVLFTYWNKVCKYNAPKETYWKKANTKRTDRRRMRTLYQIRLIFFSPTKGSYLYLFL